MCTRSGQQTEKFYLISYKQSSFPSHMLRDGHGLALGGKGRGCDLYRFGLVMLRIIDLLL